MTLAEYMKTHKEQPDYFWECLVKYGGCGQMALLPLPKETDGRCKCGRGWCLIVNRR